MDSIIHIGDSFRKLTENGVIISRILDFIFVCEYRIYGGRTEFYGRFSHCHFIQSNHLNNVIKFE